MDEIKKVTVGIFAYNTIFIRECIESILNQSRMPDEIIMAYNENNEFIDNLFIEYSKLYPDLFIKYNIYPINDYKIIYKSLLFSASGDYVICIHGDNKLHNKYINQCIKTFKKDENVSALYTDIEIFGPSPVVKLANYPKEYHNITGGKYYINLPLSCKSLLYNGNNIIKDSMVFRVDRIKQLYENQKNGLDIDQVYRDMFIKGHKIKKVLGTYLQIRSILISSIVIEKYVREIEEYKSIIEVMKRDIAAKDKLINSLLGEIHEVHEMEYIPPDNIDENKLNLNDITLICVDCVDTERAIKAINICKSYANFGDIKFLSSIKNDSPHFIQIESINSIQEYSNFIIKKLNQYVDTKFCLIIQWDGYILNPDAWTNDFYNYDYIGAPWPHLNNIVGNGGFSLRSKKLLDVVEKYLKNVYIDGSEDLIIARNYRNLLESNGIKFAPTDIGLQFSVECQGEYKGSFGFHDFKWIDPEKFGWKNPLL